MYARLASVYHERVRAHLHHDLHLAYIHIFTPHALLIICTHLITTVPNACNDSDVGQVGKKIPQICHFIAADTADTHCILNLVITPRVFALGAKKILAHFSASPPKFDTRTVDADTSNT